MFVAFAIEGFAEVERLFPCTELDFHGPAVAEEAFRTGLFATFPGFFAAFSPAGGSDFRGGTHGHEAAVLALLADDDVEVDDIFTIVF